MNINSVKETQTFGANFQTRIDIAGDFFRISESTAGVTVTLLKAGAVIGTMANFLAGDYVEKLPFDAVIIRNGATSQAITYQIATGGVGSDRVIGQVQVTGLVTTREAGTGFTNTYKSQTNLSIGGADVVFLPAANTNGVVIHLMQFASAHATNAVGNSGGYYARATLPTAALDSGCIANSENFQTVNGQLYSLCKIEKSILIPAGLGLWFFSNMAEATANRLVVYTVL